MSDSDPNIGLRYKSIAVGAITTACVILLFLLLYWNHSSGVRDPGLVVADYWLMNGFLPYRDYFVPLPFFSYLSGLPIFAAFGGVYLPLRLFALVLRILLGIIIYFWLGRLFRKSHACIGAIITVVLGSCDISEPIDSYQYHAVLLAVFSGFLASFAIDSNRSKRALVILGITSGIATSLCFFSKQTIGLAASLIVPLVVLASLYRLRGEKLWLWFLGAFSIGWALGSGSFLFWLYSEGILTDFLDQAFIKGPAAKQPFDFFYRWLYITLRFSFLSLAALLAVFFTWFPVRRSAHKDSNFSEPLSNVLLVFIGGLLAVGTGAFIHYHLPLSFQQNVDFMVVAMLTKVIIYLTLLAALSHFCFYVLLWKQLEITWRQAQFFLYAGVSLAVAAAISISYPTYETMIVPGFGLIVACCLDVFSLKTARVLIAFLALLLTGATANKLFCSFWSEGPVVQTDSESVLPEMKGFILSKQIVDFLDGTTAIIASNSSANDSIFSYPQGALFYYLSKRKPATFSTCHNIDITTDRLGAEDADRLLKNRPAVMIFAPQPNLSVLEELWRHGKRSGTRLVEEACQKLAKEYKLVHTYTLPDGMCYSVYVRPPLKTPVSSPNE